jgi:hypothetical protein
MNVIRGVETDMGSVDRNVGSHRVPGVGGDQCQTTLPCASASAIAPGSEQSSNSGIPHGVSPLVRSAVVKTTCTAVGVSRRCETETAATMVERAQAANFDASTGLPPVTLDGCSSAVS